MTSDQQRQLQRLLVPDVQATLGPELRALPAIDDPDNDRLSAEVVARSGFLK